MPNLPILVFDVNETLLDLDTLTPDFERMFGNRAVMREWFNQVILYSEALSLANQYVDFGRLGGAILRMLAEIKGCAVGEDDLSAVQKAVACMPAHPDVPPALQRLKHAGFRMVTLTNNPGAICQAQLEKAGLRGYFERLFSIDDGVERYKPAPETYRAVAKGLAVELSSLCLIACHTWDTLGAGALGLETALILRSGNARLGVGPAPDMIGTDLQVVADQLIARHAS